MTVSKNKLSGMTLVEVLVAVGLFAIVATVSTNIFLDIVDLEKKSTVQNVFYEDSRIILQQLTNYIQSGAIDYEEYYNRYVVHDKNTRGGFFGVNYGVYASRFFDPGLSFYHDPTKNPANLGVECSFPKGNDVDDCEIFYTMSFDLNTGQNPFETKSSISRNSNALCDEPLIDGVCDDPLIGHVGELYLINSSGTEKTIIAKKKTGTSGNDDWAIGIVKMEGIDVDQNGVIDTWKCKDEFNCFGQSDDEANRVATAITHDYISSSAEVFAYGITLPEYDDLSRPFDMNSSQFVPITPRRSSIKSLNFVIHPVEDPYRAYAEFDIQAHPSVTIIMTLGLSEDMESYYPGPFPDITVQTTITAGVLGKINSYPPTTDLSWISPLPIPVTPSP